MPAPDPAAIDRILAVVAEGGAIRNAIVEEGMHPSTFWSAMADSPDIQRRYGLAKECRALMRVDQMALVAMHEPDAARARNVIAVAQWEAARMHRKEWGDVLQVDGNLTIDLGQAILDARARALPMRCQPDAIEIEYTEESAPCLPTPTDNKSAEAAEEPAPALPGLFD